MFPVPAVIFWADTLGIAAGLHRRDARVREFAARLHHKLSASICRADRSRSVKGDRADPTSGKCCLTGLTGKLTRPFFARAGLVHRQGATM